jgi:hypothetical protein
MCCSGSRSGCSSGSWEEAQTGCFGCQGWQGGGAPRRAIHGKAAATRGQGRAGQGRAGYIQRMAAAVSGAQTGTGQTRARARQPGAAERAPRATAGARGCKERRLAARCPRAQARCARAVAAPGAVWTVAAPRGGGRAVAGTSSYRHQIRSDLPPGCARKRAPSQQAVAGGAPRPLSTPPGRHKSAPAGAPSGHAAARRGAPRAGGRLRARLPDARPRPAGRAALACAASFSEHKWKRIMGPGRACAAPSHRGEALHAAADRARTAADAAADNQPAAAAHAGAAALRGSCRGGRRCHAVGLAQG